MANETCALPFLLVFLGWLIRSLIPPTGALAAAPAKAFVSETPSARSGTTSLNW
jgi:hypothetical protein